jgi:hypothetical protein
MSKERVVALARGSKVSVLFRNSFMVRHLMQNYDNQGSFVKIDGSNIFVVRQNEKVISQSNFRSHSVHNETKNDADRGYLIQQDPQAIRIEALSHKVIPSNSSK